MRSLHIFIESNDIELNLHFQNASWVLYPILLQISKNNFSY